MDAHEIETDLEHMDKKKLLIGGGIAAAVLLGIWSARKKATGSTTQELTTVDTGATAPSYVPYIPSTGQTSGGSTRTGNTGGSTIPSTPVVVPTIPSTPGSSGSGSTTPTQPYTPPATYDPGQWYTPPITGAQTGGTNYRPQATTPAAPVVPVAQVPAVSAPKIVPVTTGQTSGNVTAATPTVISTPDSGYTPPMTNQEHYLASIISDPSSTPGQIEWANQALYLENLKSTGTDGQAAWASNELTTMYGDGGSTQSSSSDSGSSSSTDNQTAYLNDLVTNGTEGQAAWAQDQLNQAASSNQQQYLEDLVAQGGGNGEWAQAQLDAGNY